MRIEINIKDKIDYIEYAAEYKLFDSVIINSRYYNSIDKITLFKRKDILTIQPDITNTYY